MPLGVQPSVETSATLLIGKTRQTGSRLRKKTLKARRRYLKPGEPFALVSYSEHTER